MNTTFKETTKLKLLLATCIYLFMGFFEIVFANEPKVPEFLKGYKFLGYKGESVTLVEESVVAYGYGESFKKNYNIKGKIQLNDFEYGYANVDKSKRNLAFYKPMDTPPPGYEYLGKGGETITIDRLANIALGVDDNFAILYQVKGTIKLDKENFGFPWHVGMLDRAFIQYITPDVKKTVQMGPPGYFYLGKEGSRVNLTYKSKLALPYYNEPDEFSYIEQDRGFFDLSSNLYPETKRGIEPRNAYYKIAEWEWVNPQHAGLSIVPGISSARYKEILLLRNRLKTNESNWGNGLKEISVKMPITKEDIPPIKSYVKKGKVEAVGIFLNAARLGIPKNELDESIKRKDNPYINRSMEIFFSEEIISDYRNAKLAWSGDHIVTMSRNQVSPIQVAKVSSPSDTEGLARYEVVGIFMGQKFAYVQSLVHSSEEKTLVVISHQRAKEQIENHKANFAVYERWQKSLTTKSLVKGKIQLQYIQDTEDTTDSGAKTSYAIYLPQTINLNQKNRLLFIFHGLGGSGMKSIKGWISVADKLNLILVAPNYSPIDGGGKTDSLDLVTAIHKDISRKTDLKYKVLVTGFSAGGGIAHFTSNNHPDRLLAMAMHSSGAIGGVAMPEEQTRNVAILVTCGLKGPYCDNNAGYVSAAKEMGFRNAQYSSAKTQAEVIRITLDFFRKELVKSDD